MALRRTSGKVAFVLLAAVVLASAPLVLWAQGSVDKAAEAAAAKARAQLLGSIAPSGGAAFEAKLNENGDYVYEATAAKVLLTDGPFKLVENYQGKAGLTVATMDRINVPLGMLGNTGMYWKLGAIQPGKYWVGLVYRSDNGKVEAPANFNTLYLNGRIILANTLSDPVQIAPGVYFAEIQAQAAQPLKPGDEIAVTPYAGGDLAAARLVLHTREPARGAHRTYVNFEGFYSLPYTALRINVQCDFMGANGQPIPPAHMWWGHEQQATSPADFLVEGDASTGSGQAKAVGLLKLSNPLPVPLTIDFDCTVTTHYLKPVGRDAGQITLQPHERVTRKVPFTVLPDEPAYSMHATVKAVQPPDLGWPEADTASYFPGMRQSVPWPDAFNNKYHRRVYFSQPIKGARTGILLTGQWEISLTTELDPPFPPPADAKFEPRQVPFGRAEVNCAKMTPRPHAAYLRRTFDVSPEMAAGTCRLLIESLTSAGTAYINGKKVGAVMGECAPLVADATAAIKPGKNEVVVILRDLLAIMDPAYVNAKNPTLSMLYLDAPGLYGLECVAMDKVMMNASPAVCAEDLLVMTSYRKKTLTARFNAANRTAKPMDVIIKPVVQEAGKDVFELGQKEMTLAAGQSVPMSFEKAWPEVRLYSPQDPHLYVLAVNVVDKATGKTLDQARERFGFRESWIEGANVYFNGQVAKFKGVTGANALGIDADFQINRGASNPDYMDEIGQLASEAITGVFNTPSKHNVERDSFWDNAEKNMVAQARRVQNHPCIVAWDLSNEWYCFLPYCGADMKWGAKRLEHMSTVLKAHDPSRWTFYNGDGDLGGLHESYCGHYITWAVQPPIAGYNLAGHSVYLPDGGFYRPLEADFQPNQKIRFSTFYDDDFFVLYGQKVLMNTENLWKVGGLMPPGPSKIVGDEDVISPAMDQSGPMAWFWKNNLDGHRDVGTTSVSSYMLQGATRRGYMLQQFILPEMVHHGFAGKALTMKYDVLNDKYQPAELTLKWSLIAPDGKAVAGDQKVYKLGTCDLQRDALTLKLPAVDKKTTYVFDVRLENNGKLVYGESRDMEVWPDVLAPNTSVLTSKPPRGLFLFDPKGKTAEAFKACSLEFTALPAIAAPAAPAASSVVILGEGALDDKNAADVGKLDAFAADGGRVLILAQTTSPLNLPAAAKIDPREWSSQTFVRAGDHPILKGITDWDLHFWAPDRVVSRGAYSKPDSGPAVALIDSGTDIGMEWVQMMELYRGKGNYVLCQLPLIGKFNDEPMARELLGRSLSYLGGAQAHLSPTGKLQVITKQDGPVHNHLRKNDIAFDLVTPDKAIAPKSTVLVDVSVLASDIRNPQSAIVAGWSKAVADGATVVVCGATPDDAAWLSTLAGKEVRVTAQPFLMWHGRGYRATFDALTAGLSHCDFYYKRYDGTEPAGSQAEDPSLVIEPLQDYAVSAAGARELVFPGALVELKSGAGRVVVDQRHWMTDTERLSRYADRNLRSLAMGLGAAIAPVLVPRQLPKDVAVRPIDLTAFANRSLVDDVADDGKGGWSDQGKEADLRDFPTGKPVIDGVPFLVDKDKSCIALASNGRPGAEHMPREVTIPVGFKAEGFYFLHSAAYSGTVLTGMYQILYADGTSFDIPLRGEENIRDWASQPGPLLREKGTSSIVAWSGKCKMFPVISVYRMLWVNPKPDVPVKAIRFSNPVLEPVPILFGLTAAVAKGQGTDLSADVAKVQQLLAQASKLVSDKDDAKALELLKQAVALDPTLTTAQQALVDLYERAGDEDQALAAYQAWAMAGARTPLPYNRIGEILEKRKDFKGAMESYAKSLKVEWNQPPIIEAKKRVETKVNQ